MRVVKTFFVFLGIILFAAAVPAQTDNTAGNSNAPKTTAAPRPQDGDDVDRYLIGYEDVLEIKVMKHEDLNVKVSVSKNGTVTVPRLDAPMMAVCKTERQLADDITAAYKKDFLRNPYVSVEVTEQKSQSAAVIGAVEKPGNFYLTRKVTLLELLAHAGGPSIHSGMRLMVARTGSTSNCRQDMEVVKEGEVKIMNFKMREIQEGKTNLWMQPGDIVSVLEADPIYVFGNVRKQGRLLMKEPMTLRQALSAAEGLKSASDNKVRVLKQKEGQTKPEEFIYDLNAINKGKAPDPFLEPNDVVAVSQDNAMFFMTKIANAATGGIPSLFYRGL
jgi:polysaccharide export outer membrane protein